MNRRCLITHRKRVSQNIIKCVLVFLIHCLQDDRKDTGLPYERKLKFRELKGFILINGYGFLHCDRRNHIYYHR